MNRCGKNIKALASSITLLLCVGAYALESVDDPKLQKLVQKLAGIPRSPDYISKVPEAHSENRVTAEVYLRENFSQSDADSLLKLLLVRDGSEKSKAEALLVLRALQLDQASTSKVDSFLKDVFERYERSEGAEIGISAGMMGDIAMTIGRISPDAKEFLLPKIRGIFSKSNKLSKEQKHSHPIIFHKKCLDWAVCPATRQG